jgi:hypothetical protein
MAITREGRFVFDYDRVDAVLQELLDVEIGRYTVSQESFEKIRSLLGLADLNTEEELRAVRNAVVRRMNSVQDEIGEDNFKDIMALQTQISGITAVIDNELWHKGFPV